jgi:hypothetical protein
MTKAPKDVWKVTEREYRELLRKDGTSSPSYRQIVTWCARINGEVVEGFTTRRQAKAALLNGMCDGKK